jgi:hypothetical protein
MERGKSRRCCGLRRPWLCWKPNALMRPRRWRQRRPRQAMSMDYSLTCAMHSWEGLLRSWLTEEILDLAGDLTARFQAPP